MDASRVGALRVVADHRLTSRLKTLKPRHAGLAGMVLLAVLALTFVLNSPGEAADTAWCRWTPPVRIAPGEMHEYPDVTVDENGIAWVTWVGVREGQEHIYVRAYKGTEGLPPLDVGLGRGLQGYPRILAVQDKLYVVWSLRLPQTEGVSPWQVVARELPAKESSKAPLGELIVLSGTDEDALRPSLGQDASGMPWVAWESRVGKRFRVMARPLGASRRTQPAIEVSDGGELNLRPALAPAPGGGLQVVWDRYEATEYHILTRRIQETAGPIMRVSDEPAVNIAPSITADAQGRLFIAYQTNADGNGGQRVGKVLRVRILEGDQLTTLAGGDPPPLSTAPGRLDAVEFPTAVFDGDGRFWIFARRGQGWVIYCYEGDAWKPPLDVSEKGWGGRGREFRAAWSKEGFHLVARRLHMNAHQVLTPNSRIAKPPVLAELTPAPLFVPGASMAVTRKAPGSPSISNNLPGVGGLWSQAIAPILEKDGPAGPSDPDGNSGGERNNTGPDGKSSTPKPGSVLGPNGGFRTGSSSGKPKSSDGRPRTTKDPVKPAPVVMPEPPRPTPVPELVLEDGVGPPRKTLASVKASGQTAGEGAALPANTPSGIYFGDVHTHTWMSDGAGDPDEVYTRSRDRYRFHFVALTDHDLENGNRILPTEWAWMKLWADFFNNPNVFATFQAYEWTSPSYPRGAGHRNVYFPGDNSPLFNVAEEAPTTRTLFELLQAEGAMAAPHHIGWTGTDWEHHDPAVQRAIELISVHGAFEKPGNRPILPRAEQVGMFVRDGLLRGLKFGLIGGSDGHGFPWHYGVSRREDVWRTGLTGIMSMALNRTALHAAMMSRLTVATSGPPIGVWLHVDGSPMGTEISTDRAPRIDVRVEGMAPLQEVTLVRDGEDIQQVPVSGKRVEVTLFDEPSPGEHFYLVRVVQQDNEVAWSSPIWVEMKGPAKEGPPDP